MTDHTPAAHSPGDDTRRSEDFLQEWTPSEWHDGTDVPWTMLPRDGLIDAYEQVVEPTLRAEGKSTDARPSYEWLSAHGFRGLTYTLSNYHDTTFATWWRAEITPDADPSGYEWPVDHDETVERCEQFLEDRARGHQWADRTVESKRYRLARYVRAYAEATGDDDLLEPVAIDSEMPPHEAIAVGADAFRRLDQEVGRRRLGRIFEVVDSWYDYLVSRHLAAVNPVKPVGDDYSFDATADESDTSRANPGLDATHVNSLVTAATSTRDRLLVVALCGWGLRSSEVAALHISQFVLEGDDPHIAFDERKNGPSRVSLLYARAILADRIDELTAVNDWNGYLFPSSRSATGHINRSTVNDWFDDLADRADLPATIGGRKPVPQMGRRFWYDAYSAVVEDLAAQFEDVAAEQGSSDPAVVLDEYLSADRRRTLRREGMRERLAAAFADSQ